MRRFRSPILAAILIYMWSGLALAGDAEPEAWRVKLYEEWKNLKEPPVTPYDGPFGGSPRAFYGEVDYKHPDKEIIANWKALSDYSKSGQYGRYDWTKDPRPLNAAFEEAILEDWRRMGYNCAYKGNTFTFMVGKFLKEKGMLGAIDQTLFGNGGPPPLQFDGKEGRKQREACGSFFDAGNFQKGVNTIFGMGFHYGEHLFTVGDHRLTCSWDEVGMRTRAQMDYRDPMRAEFRKYLMEVWFQDESPDKDSNGDGRTYNAFTGETLASWDAVEPMPLSLDWTQPKYNKNGTQEFSALPDVDAKLFEQPGRYKLLIDFHRYFTFEFFRRINEDASKKMNEAGQAGRVSCYPFVQHFIIWPGSNQRHGNSFYWYHRLSPVVNVEHMWPDAPVMNLNYAITDRLAPRFKNTIMGWVWFYFGQEGADMFNGPHDCARAMARMVGHNVDGSHHWLYSPRYRGRDQGQRLQIAYWQNFFKRHYAGFLAQSEPVKPQIAMLMPDYTGYFYRLFQYPKQDFGWMGEAFQNLQYPYHILTEEELELNPQTLDDYKVLYVVGSEWSTPTIRKRIEDFIARGGVVHANVDSLSLDIPTGKRLDFLEKTFGAKLECKHKNSFFPSAASAEEAVWGLPLNRWGGPFTLQGHSVHLPEDPRAWAKLWKRTGEKYVLDENGKPKRDEMNRPILEPDCKIVRDSEGKLVRDDEVWAKLDEMLASMPRESRGLAQQPLDMRSPPAIKYPSGALAKNWAELATAQPVNGGKPIAFWGEKVVGIETEKTVWLGTREGMNLHAISPRMSHHRTTEPCNPFPSEIPELYESHRPYAEAVGYAARKAGVTRPVTAMRGDELPMNLEVLPRVDANGTLMVILVNHDKTEAEYDLGVDKAYLKPGMEAFDLLNEKTVETETDGAFKLAVPAWGVAVVVLGLPERLQPLKAVQAELNKLDLSVPQYFKDRPSLNLPEHGVRVPDPANDKPESQDSK
ncbi:MAG: hypothetical protein M5U26_05105 [Planctomycetota bacterium]|nr:hypothetical protein [Planctomycetota bacterium]